MVTQYVLKKIMVFLLTQDSYILVSQKIIPNVNLFVLSSLQHYWLVVL